MHNAIEEATGFYGFVGGVLLLTDMERDEQMERAALNHEQVYILWGLDSLREDLERIVEQVKFRRPLKPRHSENEWREVNRLQYRQPGVSESSSGGSPLSVMSLLASFIRWVPGVPGHPAISS